jgi:hypothetical protein
MNRWGYWEFLDGKFTPKELRYEDEESLPDVQSRVGIPLEPGSQFGLEDQGFMVEVRTLPGEMPARHRYVVGVNVDGCCENVMVSSLPDLIELLGKLAPLASLSLRMGAIAAGTE